MPAPFLSSEEYDERAHRLYDAGDYDAALDVLKEGITLYPSSVELQVGLGYTRLAREEFALARQCFERGLVLDPEHEEGLVGLGEALLRLGRRSEALELFARARELGCAEDLDLMLSMGRALYREQLYDEAREVFTEAVAHHPTSGEAEAALGYTLHRQGDELSARRRLRRALELEPHLHEARTFLGHLFYDRGEWQRALQEFETVAPEDHFDTLAIWRVLELKRALEGHEPGSERLAPWEARLEEIEAAIDPIDELLAEIEGGVAELEEGPADGVVHRVHTADGLVLSGSWREIVRRLRDARGLPGEAIAQFMRREAERERARSGVRIPTDDPEAFLRASARAGLLRIEC
ncbi:MAG: tetratricopeptide repeat protein [Gemmatimonadetes bacterium]|nr:tetratricopeptide repeat protein [Gemmatimonadota bacterium]